MAEAGLGAAGSEARPSWIDCAIDRMAGWIPPLSGWAFAFRIWTAMMVALYAAFWFQLDSASSAATCVAILAQPRRGQAISKSIYRLLGTVIGAIVSIVLMGLFGQDRVLLLVSFSLWLGLCVFTAQYLRDTRAYGALLSGYTVAIIALGQINTPQDTFDAATARLAAITLGILAVTFINDALGSPDAWRALVPKLEAAVGETRAFALAALSRSDPGPEPLAALIGRIAALRDDTSAIETEFDNGPFRAAGARSCIAALYVMAATSRVIANAAAALRDHDAEVDEALAICRRVAEEPEAESFARDDARMRVLVDDAIRDGRKPLDAIVMLQRALDFVCAAHFVDDGLRALADGHAPLRDSRLPTHRDFPLALRNTVRVITGFAVTAAAMVASGLPQAASALVQVAALAALASTNPNPNGFARGAVIGMILAAILAGIDRYLVLEYTSGFPLLAISFAPVIFLGCFLTLHPRTFAIGFIVIVFFPVLVAPSNPQTYDPLTFLLAALFAILPTMILAVVVAVVLPTSDGQKRAFALASARSSLADALAGEGGDATTRTSLNADRLLQFSGYHSGSGAVRRAGLMHAFVLARLEAAAARAHGQLRLLWSVDAMRGTIVTARNALADGDAAELEGSAGDLVRAASDEPLAVRMAVARAVSDLVTAARLIARHRRFLRRLDIARF